MFGTQARGIQKQPTICTRVGAITRRWAVFLLVLGFTAVGHPGTEGKSLTRDEQVWLLFGPAIGEFQSTGARDKFLATCKELHDNYSGSQYEQELTSLIQSLEKERATPVPEYVRKPARARTPEETIHFWIYYLREVNGWQTSSPGYPEIFSIDGKHLMTTDELVAIGPRAIPFLIEALEDDTPTRTIACQRFFYPVRFVLRRQDLAMKCLEQITACHFYEEGATFIHLYMDKAERRQSAIENVRAWWKISEGCTQAQMIRNQLKLRQQNITLRGYDQISALRVLAALEGPEAVIKEARALLADDRYGLNSPVAELMNEIDPQTLIQAAFARFRRRQSRDGDYYYLLKYADRTIYQELARRFETTGKLDPGSWNMPDQFTCALRYGRNWAIPLLAKGLDLTEMSDAESALKYFQQQTEQDFGYRPEMGKQQLLSVLSKARQWWQEEGEKKMADVIAADHPPLIPLGDLFLGGNEIAARVRAIESTAPMVRRKAIGRLGTSYSFEVQRALLNALKMEPEAAERMNILRVLQQHPVLWHLPALTRVLSSDPEVGPRLLAGEILATLLQNKTTQMWWVRLETRDAVLDTARRLLQQPDAATGIKKIAEKILNAWGR